jgi:predicted Zn-dependent peptidase
VSFYSKTVLPTGVTVLSERMDAVRSVALGIWFAVGSRDEAPAEAGMSHFMEHMMFKGTPTRDAASISETFDRLGAELNAFTGKEYTCYYSRILDEHLDVAVEVLSDMVVSSLLASDAIMSEREVVLEEISRHEDSPEDAVHDLFAAALIPGHPLGLPVLGTRDSVGAFDAAQSRVFHDRLYVTGNVVVAAAGAIDHDALVALVERFLQPPEGPRIARADAPGPGPIPVTAIEKTTEQAHICWGVRGLKAGDEDRFTLSIIDTVLGGGMSSRLFQEIREKRGLAYAVYSYHSLFQDEGQFVVYAGTRPANAAEVVALIQAETGRLASAGVTDDELYRAKESLKGSLVLGLESTRARMTRLGKNEITHGECLSVDELVARVDAVTAQHVAALADRLLSASSTLAVISPLAASEVERFATSN